MKPKPIFVLITGAPGSGKSSIAKLLNEKLYGYTHIDPDDVLQSFWEQNKDDKSYDREKVGIPKFKSIINSLVKSNIQLIVDVQADLDFIKTLMASTRLINIHCIADNTAQRFYEREVSSDGSIPDWLAGHMPEINRLEKTARDPIDIGQKILILDCDDGYKPEIEEIIKDIENQGDKL